MRWLASLPIVPLLAMVSQGEDRIPLAETIEDVISVPGAEAAGTTLLEDVYNSFECPVAPAESLTGFDFPMSKS